MIVRCLVMTCWWLNAFKTPSCFQRAFPCRFLRRIRCQKPNSRLWLWPWSIMKHHEASWSCEFMQQFVTSPDVPLFDEILDFWHVKRWCYRKNQRSLLPSVLRCFKGRPKYDHTGGPEGLSGSLCTFHSVVCASNCLDGRYNIVIQANQSEMPHEQISSFVPFFPKLLAKVQKFRPTEHKTIRLSSSLSGALNHINV